MLKPPVDDSRSISSTPRRYLATSVHHLV